MAYKKGEIKNNNDVKEITKSFFSNDTLGKAQEVNEQLQERRSYNKHFVIKSKENKTHTVTMRLTDTEFNDLMAKVEKSRLGTVTNYLKQLIKKG